jgi:hypothetical protein
MYWLTSRLEITSYESSHGATSKAVECKAAGCLSVATDGAPVTGAEQTSC